MITEAAFWTIPNLDGGRFYAVVMLVGAFVISIMLWRDSKATTPLPKRCRVCGGRIAITAAGALVHDGDAHLVARQDVHVAEPVDREPLSLADLTSMLEDAAKAGCPGPDCPELTVCDMCGQFVCRDHTEDAVDCEVNHSPHHHDCALQCRHCMDAYAADMAEERAIEEWKESRR